MSLPKAFISYSHDSLEHKKWVLALATRLRAMGVDAILDQWELTPGDDIPHFMERNLVAADRVIMICTERYVQKANAGSGGVGYEKMIVTSEQMRSINSNKVVPVLRQTGTYLLPTFLQSKLYINFSKDDDFEFSIDELARALHAAPLYAKPPIGSSPFADAPKAAVATADPLREVMRILAIDFESHQKSWSNYPQVLANSRLSRVMFDVLVAQARDTGLVRVDGQGDIWLLDKGKFYIVQNDLLPK